jgi:AcrR family transcriptional regulator
MATLPSAKVEIPAKKLNDSAEQLLQATASLLSERPDLDVSFSDIAKRSGLNSALIKYYFGNKEGLLLQLLERDAQAQMGSLASLVATDIPAAQKLRVHIGGILNAFFKSPYLNRLIHHMIEYADSPSSRRVVEIYVTPMIDSYRQIIDQGVAEGSFRRIHPGSLYCIVVGACDYLFSGVNIIPQIMNEAKVTEELKQRYFGDVAELILAGLKP